MAEHFMEKDVDVKFAERPKENTMLTGINRMLCKLFGHKWNLHRSKIFKKPYRRIYCLRCEHCW